MSPRILIVRFSAIGDCVMAAWIATAFRNKFGDSTIDWAIETRCKAVVNVGHLCNEVIEVPRERWKSQPKVNSLFDQLRFFVGLRERSYDFGIDLQGHGKTALCLRFANPKKRLAVNSTDPFSEKLNPVFKPSVPHRHVIEDWLEAASQWASLDMPSRPIMPELKSEGKPKRPLVTIAVSAGHPDKAYPVSKWDRVAKSLIEHGIAVEFLGGPSDSSPGTSGAIDYVGKLTLAQSMQRIASSSITLCSDTGAGHIAAAYGVPCISIFGPTNPQKVRPYSPLSTVLSNGNQVESVSVEQILEATWRTLGKEILS